MKSSQWHSRVSITFFLLTLVLALFSWIGSVYGIGELQSLLSAEGIRWVLGHTLENYVQAPALGMVLVFFMGLGVGVRSGLYDALRRFVQKGKMVSRKERRALVLSVSVFVLWGILVGISLFLPWNLFWGVTGGWLHSPISKGMVYLLAVGVGLAGMIYGYVADVYRNLSDVLRGMSCLIARRASFFVTLFFVVQFFSSLEYVRLAEFLHFPEEILSVIYQLCCFIPMFF